jgi:hypothetical protein
VVHRTIGAWRVWIDQPGQTHSRLGSTEGATHSASCTIDVSIRCVARHPPTQIAEAHGMPPVEIISRETSLYRLSPPTLSPANVQPLLRATIDSQGLGVARRRHELISHPNPYWPDSHPTIH